MRFVIVAAVALLLWGLPQVTTIVIPVLIAILLAALLQPVVKILTRYTFLGRTAASGIALLGLLLVMLTGWHWVDPAVAIVMALNILYEGGQLIWRSTQGLMDAAVEPEVQAQVDAVVGRFVQAQAATPGLRVDHAMSRRAGQRLFLSVHLHLPADWSLRRAAALGGELERALLAALPQLQVSVQLLPLDTEPAGVPAAGEGDACTP